MLSQTPNKEAHTNTRGTRVTPVPRWHANNTTPAITSDQHALPPEIRGIILDYLDGDISSKTKKYFFAASRPKKFIFFNQTDLPVTIFLNHVVHGDFKKAKAMLDKNPSLVFYRGQVTDYSGRTLEGTAYQIALGAEDVSRQGHMDEGMADMIRGYFIKALENDENHANEEIEKQFKEQFPEIEFPEYYETDEKKRTTIIRRKEAFDPDIIALEKVANAILHADTKEIQAIRTGTQDRHAYDNLELKVTGECAKALQAFRDYLKPQTVIKKGKHFNTQLLIKALDKYISNQYNLFGGHWNTPKNLLFWRQVIGYIQRYMPANLAQAFCQGLWNMTTGGSSLERNLKLEDESFFYPLNLSSSPGLGFDHSICSYYENGAYTGLVAGYAVGPREVLTHLHRAKTEVFRLPMQYVEKQLEKHASCVIL